MTVTDHNSTKPTAVQTESLPGYRAGTWQIDADHSEVGFIVRHMMLSKVRGRFTSFSGSITTNEDITASKVSAQIDLGSVHTGSDKRDEHLRSPDFFGGADHTMSFESTAIRQEGHDWFIDGTLTIKGISHPVSLATEVLGFGPDLYGGFRAGFAAKATINRTDFGIVWNAPIEGGGVLVGEKVEISLDIQAVYQD